MLLMMRKIPTLHPNMFLLNHTREAIQGVNYNTLHPNMFLLNHVPFSWYKKIHITLHANMFLLNLYDLLIHVSLSLPLHPNMFLLNRGNIQIPTGGTVFTSQYVSIKSSSFTSTNSPFFTLHPNMFLLNPGEAMEYMAMACLYIPICFY